jgi:hypothetical protein
MDSEDAMVVQVIMTIGFFLLAGILWHGVWKTKKDKNR